LPTTAEGAGGEETLVAEGVRGGRMTDDESRQVRQACLLQGESVAELREWREGVCQGERMER
jgi:hypothetical protein